MVWIYFTKLSLTELVACLYSGRAAVPCLEAVVDI
jgi:hypothetical protein